MKSLIIVKIEIAKLLIGILLLFAISGRLSYWQAYGYVFVNLILLIILTMMLLKKKNFTNILNIDPSYKQNKSVLDRLWVIIYWLIYFGIIIVASLDTGKYAWTQECHFVVYILAYIVYVASYFLILWAMTTNKYFYSSKLLHNSHDLIQKGPYIFIRHPAYLGSIFLLICSALILGSLWALIPASLGILQLIIRIVREEGLLCVDIIDYLDYTKRVKYKLMPGIW